MDGNRLRALREYHGAAQAEVARAAGLFQSDISAIESGLKTSEVLRDRMAVGVSRATTPSRVLARHGDAMRTWLESQGIGNVRVFGSTARGEADFFDTDDDRTFEAVQMRIINLGHAIASLSPAQRHRIGFAAIALHKMRSRIAHDYLRVDRRLIWKTATRDLPALADTLRTILAESVPTSIDRDRVALRDLDRRVQ